MNKKRILLTEDSITNQRLCLAILKKLGYRADVAANGKEALQALCSASYDLVLMDCQMPEMDGYETSRLIRDPTTDIPNHSIPVVALTGDTTDDGREKCLNAGMNDYITKPLDLKELGRILVRWLPTESEGGAAGHREVGLSAGSGSGGEGGSSVFDKAEVLGRLDGDRELLETIVTGFLEDLPSQIAILQKSINSGDLTGTKLQAHKIKGAAATVGAETTRAAAFRIEEAGETGRIQVMSVLLHALTEQFNRFRQMWETMDDL